MADVRTKGESSISCLTGSAVLNGQQTEKGPLNWKDLSYPQDPPKDFETYPPAITASG